MILLPQLSQYLGLQACAAVPTEDVVFVNREKGSLPGRRKRQKLQKCSFSIGETPRASVWRAWGLTEGVNSEVGFLETCGLVGLSSDDITV